MNFSYSEAELDFLLDPRAIRERTAKLYERAKTGAGYFILNEDLIEDTALYVLDVIQDNYPDLDIPLHSAWGHFNVGGLHRIAALDDKVSSADKLEKARLKLDLVITSVLIDAGASSSGTYLSSLQMFDQGLFSNDGRPFRVDGEKLLELKDLELLKKLGRVCVENKTIFKDGRPGNILDYLIEKNGMKLNAEDLLKAVFLGFGEVIPEDSWQHSALGERGSFDTLVPFHKLSQWLAYSMVSPISSSGVELWAIEELTGLADERNGGLFIDQKVIELKDKELYKIEHALESELIVEWRALTIQLLERVGEHIQKALGKKAYEFPLGRVLEGGTYSAGKRIAQEFRSAGAPPLRVKS